MQTPGKVIQHLNRFVLGFRLVVVVCLEVFGCVVLGCFFCVVFLAVFYFFCVFFVWVGFFFVLFFLMNSITPLSPQKRGLEFILSQVLLAFIISIIS